MADVVTLADVRAHLRYPDANTSDDVALQGFIAAADDVIRTECGDVISATYDEYYDGGDYALYLRHTPLLTVTTVEEGWGWINYTLDFVQVNTVPAASMFAYSIDLPLQGKISRRSAGNVPIPFQAGQGNIHVSYTAGRATVPGAVRLAALELIAHWWQNSQFRTSSAGGAYGAFDAVNEDFTRTTGVTPVSSGVPYRVLELLKPYKRSPIIG